MLTIAAVVWTWTALQISPTEESKKRFEASLSIVTTAATIVTGVFLVLNYTATQEKNKIDTDFAEKRLTMERFTKAVEMLGNKDSIHVRLGGIYSLESIANDSDPKEPDEIYRQVFEVLTAFVRENSPYPPKDKKQEGSSEPAQPAEKIEEAVVAEDKPQPILPLPTDIQAVLTVIKRRKHKNTDWEHFRFDLRKSDLRAALLRYAHLQRIDFRYANLQGIELVSANLQRADLEGANLQRANFRGANLQGAELMGANLQEANLLDANFQRAMLWNPYIEEFDLPQAKEEAKAMLTSALHWQTAKYDPEIRELLGLPPEPSNSD
ncbi:pentapeptide repeat-containing protein [Leptolyngbya ohadii]|uniref:pentapeptide repeat-containing protein n=1 Tax=Leptolyngbya ohadii TaxID=1962290 RepID=UPI0015C61975|nr:pentapeptide repeat-containing protein [Leptolyngbya ohadii]